MTKPEKTVKTAVEVGYQAAENNKDLEKVLERIEQAGEKDE